MLFMVEMEVSLPPDMESAQAAQLKADEKALAAKYQEVGVWRHLWRVAGRYANVSIFDVDSTQALHDMLMSLPLFPYMTMKVTALCRHPSSVRDDDR